MKKKIRLLPFILAILLLFAACAPAVTEANKTGAVTYPGIDWLATPGIMMKALGKNADSFGITNSSTNGSANYTVKTTVFGENASVVFTFWPDLDDEGLYLHTVSITFEKKDKDTYQKIKTALEQEIDRQIVAVDSQELLQQIFVNEDGSRTYEIIPFDADPFASNAGGYSLTFTADSVIRTGDLPDEIQEKVTAFALEYGAIKKGGDGGMTYGEIINMPLSETILTYTEMEDGRSGIALRFEARGYCTMMSAYNAD